MKGAVVQLPERVAQGLIAYSEGRFWEPWEPRSFGEFIILHAYPPPLLFHVRRVGDAVDVYWRVEKGKRRGNIKRFTSPQALLDYFNHAAKGHGALPLQQGDAAEMALDYLFFRKREQNFASIDVRPSEPLKKQGAF